MLLKNRSGFTLIELMITIAVLAVIAAIAMPSFQSILDRRKVVAAAENLFADLQYARSEAIKQNRNVQFQFDVNTWCYGINDNGVDCDCSDNPSDCTISNQLKIMQGTTFANVGLTATGFTDDSIIFSPRQGMSDDAGTFVFAINGISSVVSLNRLGRVSMD